VLHTAAVLQSDGFLPGAHLAQTPQHLALHREGIAVSKTRFGGDSSDEGGNPSPSVVVPDLACFGSDFRFHGSKRVLGGTAEGVQETAAGGK
jgi:hypothetical protein